MPGILVICQGDTAGKTPDQSYLDRDDQEMLRTCFAQLIGCGTTIAEKKLVEKSPMSAYVIENVIKDAKVVEADRGISLPARRTVSRVS